MILSQLSTEKEVKDFLDENALSLLVGYLGKCVRNEIPEDNRWGHNRCMMICSTLEKMITSDEHLVAPLLKFDIVSLLQKILDSPDKIVSYARAELRATLTCLWALSQDADALKFMASNSLLVKCMAKYSYSIKGAFEYKYNGK